MIRWGILGCGNIAARMATVLNGMPDHSLEAVAARDAGQAKSFANIHGVPHAYGGYEKLTADPGIDAVYVANIHPAHAAAVRQCLLGGKAVLCEKPLTMSAQQAAELFALAQERRLLLMEGIWTRFLPAWQEIRRLIEAGEIGEVRYMQADFSCYAPFDPESRLYNLSKGGGALLDVGVYVLHMAVHVLGRNYSSLSAKGRLSPTGSDSFACVTLRFPNGAIADVTCGCDVNGSLDARIFGTGGSIVVERMFDADRFVIDQNGVKREVVFPHPDGFRYEVQEFASLLRQGRTKSTVALPEDTIAVAKMIDEAMAIIR